MPKVRPDRLMLQNNLMLQFKSIATEIIPLETRRFIPGVQHTTIGQMDRCYAPSLT